jgi:hypothetical protein
MASADQSFDPIVGEAGWDRIGWSDLAPRSRQVVYSNLISAIVRPPVNDGKSRTNGRDVIDTISQPW